MNLDRYPHIAQLENLQGFIRQCIPDLDAEKGAGRDVLVIAQTALAKPTLPKAYFAVAAILYWLTERRVLEAPVTKSARRSKSVGPDIRVHRGKGHAGKGSSTARAIRIARDGIGLGSHPK